MAKPYRNPSFLCLCLALLVAGSLPTTDAYAQRSVPLPPPPPIIWPDERPADPARWTEEDITPEQKYETARKESLAAHQIAQTYCKTLPTSDQAICSAQARLEFEKELAEIKIRFGMTR
ncbi:hypothetical protein [Zwartia sp.]|uniref:hypothetical protein n=1 Tax=Zwartia sp. TaxID=2978004 RepID=UPI002724BFAD|nr:hypothetical protein [Zwartia sp.]MDO9023938.1 hypothetical protein [Zwartia sp.]